MTIKMFDQSKVSVFLLAAWNVGILWVWKGRFDDHQKFPHTWNLTSGTPWFFLMSKPEPSPSRDLVISGSSRKNFTGVAEVRVIPIRIIKPFRPRETYAPFNDSTDLALHWPRKINGWNLKIHPIEKEIIFQTSILGFHVNFPGCMYIYMSISCLICLYGRFFSHISHIQLCSYCVEDKFKSKHHKTFNIMWQLHLQPTLPPPPTKKTHPSSGTRLVWTLYTMTIYKYM